MEAPPRPRARLIVFLCFVIVMIDGYDTIMVSFIAPLLQHAYALSLHDIARLFAMGYVGTIIGALIAGWFADRVGRKSVLLICLSVAGSATLLCAAVTSFEMLPALRLLAGLGLGGAMPCLTALTAEHAPVERRSAVVMAMYMGYPVGAVVGGLITSFFLAQGWRDIFTGGGIAMLATVLAAVFIPETFRSLPAGRVDSPRLRTKWAQMGEQFAEGRLGPALMVWIGQFCMLLLLFLLTSWTPTMAVRSGLTLQTAAVCGVILNLGGVVGALALRGAVNRHGPFVPAAVMVGMGALMIVLLGQTMGSTPLLMIVLLLVGITALGGQLICPAIIVELFPVLVRGAGAGCAFAAGRVGSIVGPLLGGMLLSANLKLGWLYAIVALPAAIAAVVFALANRMRQTPSPPVLDVHTKLPEPHL
jgi:AAHS family 4-hydroxybenzoate transporter-like MFS transporter